MKCQTFSGKNKTNISKNHHLKILPGSYALDQHCFNPFKSGDPNQDPVVQRIVSLTSSLRDILLTVLADSIYNILIFFAEKIGVAFVLQKLFTFFQQKISAYLRITRCKF